MSPSHPDPSPCVLLVEDNADLRETLSELMGAQGVRVETARDGVEGLALLRAGLRPQAVFLDKVMPRLDGAGMLAAMLEDPALATIPTVWMSGDPRQPPKTAALLEKPFSVDDLMAVLGSLRDAD